MRAFVILAMFGVLMATMPAASAHHSDGISPILPFGSDHHGGETFQATVGDTLEFGSRWGTCSRGLAQAYLSNAEVVVTVDGEELKEAGWSQPVNPEFDISSSDFAELCTSNSYRETGWWVFWKAPFTFVEPGIYTVAVEVTHTANIHDGGGSGVEPGDVFSGEVFVDVSA